MVVAEEARRPRWAAAMPVLYLAVCALALRAVFQDPTADGNVLWSAFAALNLPCAFAIPAVFTTRKVTLVIANGALVVDGRACAIHDLWTERHAAGAVTLHVVARSGRRRAFAFGHFTEANAIAHAWAARATVAFVDRPPWVRPDPTPARDPAI